MLALKKTTIAVLVFGSSTVFAGSMGPVCATGSVTVPCEHTAWDVGIQALYLNPNYSIGSFTSSYSSPPTSETSSNLTTQSANANWNWGFKLEGAYLFRSGNDIDLNWYHYNHTATKNITNGPAPYSSITDSLTNADLYSNVSAYQKTQWNAINIELGQHVDFGKWKKIRFHGGFEYANIQTTSTNLQISPNTATVFDDSNITSSTATMKYSGFGPRIGADLSYDVENGVAFYAKAASALLAGSQQFNATVIAVEQPIDIDTQSSSNTAIIPELEAKTGATYTCNMARGDLSVDLGWMWVNYFNAQAFQGNQSTLTTDFGVQGPYIGLKWVGNIA